MSQRDRYLLIGIAVLGAVAAFWMLALQPKMSTLSDVKADLDTANSSLEQSRAEAAQYAEARLDFPTAYTQVARLGKAVPANTDEASLIFQIEKAADRAGVEFSTLALDSAGGAEAAPTTPPAAPAPAPGATGEAGATGAAGATAAPATATPAPATEELLGSVPADAMATATAPTGATTGAANLRVMHFTLEFNGSFFRLEDFLRQIKRMTWSNKKQLNVAGRLVAVDSIAFDSSGRHVTMNATTYVLPAGQGLFAGATPTGPADASQGTQAASTPATPAVPPAAAVRVR